MKAKYVYKIIACLVLPTLAIASMREEATLLENIYHSKAKAVIDPLLPNQQYSLIVAAKIKEDEYKLKEFKDELAKATQNQPGLEYNLLHELKQKVDLQLVINESVPADRDALIHDLLKSKLHLNEESGDTITITRATQSPVQNSLWFTVIATFVALTLAGIVVIIFRSQKKKSTIEQPVRPQLVSTEENELKENELMKAEVIKTPDQLEQERNVLEMQIAFAKGELVKIVKEYPSIVCKAAEEFFHQGKVNETTIFFEALGWENARKLFKDIDTRMWSRIGSSLRERERDPNLTEIYNAVHVFHRFALSFVLERAGRESENPFSFIFQLEDSTRIDLLNQENAFNIALIGLFSAGTQMAELLGDLTPTKQNQVLLEMTKIQHLPETQIKESLDAFLMRLERIKADPFIHAKGDILASDFIRSLEPYREEQLFALLLKDHPREAERLRRARVIFSDIPYYPIDMVKNVIGSIEPDELMKALVGYESDFVDSFLDILPKKRALMIQNDLYHMSDYPPHSQCAEYRRKIVTRLESELEQNRLKLDEYWKQLDGESETTPEGIGSDDAWSIGSDSKAS